MMNFKLPQDFEDYYNRIVRSSFHVSQSFVADPVAFCTENPLAIMAHPDNCARYIDCTNRDSLIGQYQQECKYPDLFDSYNNSCKSYREINCGTRPEPKAPCKYPLIPGVS